MNSFRFMRRLSIRLDRVKDRVRASEPDSEGIEANWMEYEKQYVATL